MTSTAPATTPSSHPPQSQSQFTNLLSSTLETIFHQLLYSRSIYPPDSFVLHRHFGVRCHASRVPAVGEYIGDFLRVAVPAVVVGGVGDSMSFVVLEEEVVAAAAAGGGAGEFRQVGERTGKTKTLERFVFQFQMDNIIRATPDESLNARSKMTGSSYKSNYEYDDIMDIEHDDGEQRLFQEQQKQKERALKLDTQLATDAKIQLERSMRECLLRILALRGRRRRRGERAENLSFKLCLHVKNRERDANDGEGMLHGKNTSGANDTEGNYERDGEGRQTLSPKSCPELMEALNQGEWFMPEESSCLFSSSLTAPNDDSADASQDNSLIKKGLLRPIKDVNLPCCGMRMQMGMEVDPF